MEIFILPVVLLVIGGALTKLYLADKAGWHSVGKRIQTAVRAHIGAKKDPNKDKMLPMLDSDEWTRQFEGKPAELPESKKAHFIIKTDFERTHLGDWPRWKCKCGVSQSEPVLPSYGLQEAIKDAKKKSDRHVAEGNRQEEIKAEYRAKGITGREW